MRFALSDSFIGIQGKIETFRSFIVEQSRYCLTQTKGC